MANGNARNESIWPMITVIVGIIAVAAIGWDVMLHNEAQGLDRRLRKAETQLSAIEIKDKKVEDAAAAARKKARAAAAKEKENGTQDDKKPDK
jgi:hypothetical protein